MYMLLGDRETLYSTLQAPARNQIDAIPPPTVLFIERFKFIDIHICICVIRRPSIVLSSRHLMMMMILSLGTPPSPNKTHSSETPRSADTRVYRAGRYRPETHRYRRKG